MKKFSFFLAILLSTTLFSVAQEPEPSPDTQTELSATASQGDKSDEVILEVAKGLGVTIDTSATAPEIAGQIIEAYKGVPVKGSPVSAWIVFVMSILGTIGTIYYYVRHRLIKSKLKSKEE